MKNKFASSNTPLVSVIIPAFNAASTLKIALDSVFSQTMTDLEVIVCDDASTDSTPELLRSISDPRFKHIQNKKNLGPGLSRDRAIERASGSWVAFIDADDAWRPERLERLLNGVRDYPNSIIFDDLKICHSADGKLIPWRSVHGSVAFGGKGTATRELKVENYITSPRLVIQPMIPMAAIKKYNLKHSSRPFGEDAEYYLRLAFSGVGFCYLPEPLYLYRVQPGSATSKAGIEEMRKCIQDCAAWQGWPDSIIVAFNKKITSLRQNETLYSIADHVTKRKFFFALKELWLNPAVLGILPRRIAKHFSYQLHRLLHGGARRTINKSELGSDS